MGGDASSGAGAGGGAGEAAIEPFISEYVEGSSASGNVKALEIAAVREGSLIGCKINVYANGLTKLSRTIELVERVSPEAPLVICSSLNATAACTRQESLPFNGNDAILLYCGDAIADAFGRLGEDPGEPGWLGGGFGTTDVTLRRRCAILRGDGVEDDGFDPSLEWTKAGKDVLSGLGMHCDGSTDDGAGSGGSSAGGAESGGASGSNAGGGNSNGGAADPGGGAPPSE